MTTVHFICRGNTHRSLMAEAYLKSLGLKDVTVMSSGSVADKYRSQNEPRLPRIKAMLAEYGIAKFAKDHPEQLTQERIDEADITICMNQIVFDECNHLFKMPANTQVWGINDTNEGQFIVKPGEDTFKFTPTIYRQITRKIDELVHQL